METIFCTDDALAYMRSRTSFECDEGLLLDEAYRLAHLPLVASTHPRVIEAKEGAPYAMGRHPTAYSVVLPVSAETLEASPVFCELDNEIRNASFAPKIAWHILDRRRAMLHATVCGGLGAQSPVIGPYACAELARVGPLAVEIRGLFSGNINRGRLYLRVYPEQRSGMNMLHEVQRILGRPSTDLYVIGLYNLLDDLDSTEAAELAGLIDRWWSRALLRLDATELWVVGARDDLVLDSEIAARLSLI